VSGTKPADDAVDILGAQVATLWKVLRIVATTHPNLDALIGELLKLEQTELDQSVSYPLSERALELSRAMLRETLEELESIRNDQKKT
jgi:hypothetical protein